MEMIQPNISWVD